jgi:hypothetical protein
VPAPFGYLPNQNQQLFNFSNSQSNAPMPFSSSPNMQSALLQTSPRQPPSLTYTDLSPKTSMDANIPIYSYPPTTQFTSLPTTFADLPQWNPTFTMPAQDAYNMTTMGMASSPFYNEAYAANQGYELMHDLEMNETKTIEMMIEQSHQLFRPPQLQTY